MIHRPPGSPPEAPAPKIAGWCDSRFQGLKEALHGNFAERGELGAAVAVTLEGRLVADLWAGWMDRSRTRPWREDTLVNVFSVGKAMAALCVLKLIERGRVDLDAPVASYWPDFGAAGKSGITVETLLSHRAGLPAVRRRLPEGAMYDWGLMTAALAEQDPWWEPGTLHGYHVNTFGFLIGEIVRRAGSMRPGAFFEAEFAGPLEADLRFGVGPRDVARTADFHFSEDTIGSPEETSDELPLLQARAYLNPPGASGVGTVNSRAWRSAEMPSTNAHATARGIARVYSALTAGGKVDGIRVLDPATIERATAEASAGLDVVLGRPSRFGLGFQLTQAERPLGPNARSFGHFGVGGSVGFADPDAGLAFAYTMNHGGPRWQNPRNRALIDALYEAL